MKCSETDHHKFVQENLAKLFEPTLFKKVSFAGRKGKITFKSTSTCRCLKGIF
jgi:hypothetical protein